MKILSKRKSCVVIVGLMLLCGPLPGFALCLKDCSPSQAEAKPALRSFSSAEQRDQSHNFGDVKNSVVGDVNIRVGHEHIEIGNFGESSKNNIVDASIQSTIILGDLKK